MPADAVTSARPGFFGKLPGAGDFVGRGFDPALTASLTAWSDRLIAHLRAAAGEDWLPVFDRLQPVCWIAGGGVCGAGAFAGLMRPSRDRVGRRYPLVVGASLPPATQVVPAATSGIGWFDYLDALVNETWSTTLDADRLAVALAEAPAFPETGSDIVATMAPVATGGWHVRWSGRLRRQEMSAQILEAAAGATLGRHCLFWTQRAEDGADMLIVPGLATADQLLALAL